MSRTPGRKNLNILDLRRRGCVFALLLPLLLPLSCRGKAPSELSDYPLCSPAALDEDQDGWGWENNQSCRVPPVCSHAGLDPDGDGWGWEDAASCRVIDKDSGYQLVKFSTTYYPFRHEHFFQTVCGDADAHDGLYFAVTENSPLWSQSCENESWADCTNEDCLGKWDRIPDDAKRLVNGEKKVREPRCDIPCGQSFHVYSEDKRIASRAVTYDACPSQHWNNRFKEVTEGTNPCAKGNLHVDLRKPLYLRLNRGKESGNIKVWIKIP